MASSTWNTSTSATTMSQPWGVEDAFLNVFPQSYERTSMPDELPPPWDAQPEARIAKDNGRSPVAVRDALYIQQAARAALRGDFVTGSSCHPSDEVSQGVLRDGRWTFKHPSVMHYIEMTRKQHGFSFPEDLFDSCPLPEDLRTYALVALRMQDHYNWPVWWVLFNSKQKEMTKRMIEMQLRIEQSISVDYVEEDVDANIDEGHKAMRFKVPEDWLTLEAKAIKQSELSEERSRKRKLDEMEAARENNGPSSRPMKKRRNGPRLTLRKKHRAAKKAVEATDDIVALDNDDDDNTADIVGGEPFAPPTASKEAMEPSIISAQKDSAVADGLPAAEYISRPEPKTLKVAKPSRMSSRLQARNIPAIPALPISQGKPSRALPTAELKVDRSSVATPSGSSTAVQSVTGTQSTAVSSRPRRARRRPSGKVDKDKSTTQWVQGLKVPGELATIEEEPDLKEPQHVKNGKSTKGKGAAKISPEENAAQTENDMEAVIPARCSRKAASSTKLTIKINLKGAEKFSTESSAAQKQEDLEAVPPAERASKAAPNEEATKPEEVAKPEDAARPEDAAKPEEPALKPFDGRSRRTRQKSRKAIEAAESAAQLAAKRRSSRKKGATAAAAAESSK
ncbi:hypothetical protein NEOLEDRAFT_1183688 [Neolentinus lepideus HHB14362 ss-1]|uniref:Uncharacterized protein n=1 Tax=Neolentinus lepideus HHB14362 ss-1 TaxID=1314782 RepID=A0A165N1I1_9AGAM|nr:hypothetical protein NEOLEDRAFT_1183688 [Neolentinus lepideus HHB14362 ss-1]